MYKRQDNCQPITTVNLILNYILGVLKENTEEHKNVLSDASITVNKELKAAVMTESWTIGND